EIATEIVSMNLVGNLVPAVGASIPVTVMESPTRASVGKVIETGLPSSFPGDFPADSFFDVFIELDLPGGLTVFNKDAAYVLAEGITSLPPAFPTPYPIKGWIDEGSPLIGQLIDLNNPPLGFNLLPLPLYIQDPLGGPDIQVGQLLNGDHIVPEPAALGLLALGGLMAARRRR
ncbi:MAG: PEP-CTERM sorting domain-containing protein, partial [Phycisphaerae bacterium]